MNTHNLITDSLLLPSGGKLYGSNFNGNLNLRCMTTVEERMRLGSTNFYETMSTIINRCIVDNYKNPDNTYFIDSKAFTDFDFFAVLIKLRIMSYGPKYKTYAQCTTCNHTFNYTMDLTELQYNMLPDDFKEPYLIGPLPMSGDTLGCRFLRIKDYIDNQQKKKEYMAKNPDEPGDVLYTLEMERRIMTVNNKPLDEVQAHEYVESMIGLDSTYYHSHIDKKSYGVIRLGTTTCPKCGGVGIYNLVYNTEFFRPSLDD